MCVSISQETVELNRVHLGPENGPNYIILKNLEPKQQTSHVHQYPKNKSLQWKEWAARSMSNSMATSGVARCVQDSVGSSLLINFSASTFSSKSVGYFRQTNKLFLLKQLEWMLVRTFRFENMTLVVVSKGVSRIINLSLNRGLP